FFLISRRCFSHSDHARLNASVRRTEFIGREEKTSESESEPEPDARENLLVSVCLTFCFRGLPPLLPFSRRRSTLAITASRSAWHRRFIRRPRPSCTNLEASAGQMFSISSAVTRKSRARRVGHA